MKAIEIRNKYLNFFKAHGHQVIPSASLIPENDPSVLFTTAGMQPLVPYLLGQPHPEGTRLTDFQKCVRTNDIDEVGDNRHLTYFEMLGNWSLGDYFKEESIKMSFEFLTKELGIPVEKLSVTVFKGDEDCPRDEVAASCWKKAGILDGHIYYYGKDDNWWIAGETGPCGPDTEMFYDTGKPACSPNCQPSCDCGKYVEIWNNVFMEYFKDEKGYSKLEQRNVDTGLGLERMTMLLQGKETPFETELFAPIMDKLVELQKVDNIASRRIVAEHLRSSMMIICDGGRPSNVDRGYILRRLIRRMVRHMNKLQISLDELSTLIDINVENLKEMYPALEANKETIIDENSVNDVILKALISGEEIDREKVLMIPAVSSAVGLICDSFAMIPFKLYRKTTKDGKKQTSEVEDDRVNIINLDTEDTLDGFQFKKAIAEDYLLGKGGYAYINKKGNNFVGLNYVEEKK